MAQGVGSSSSRMVVVRPFQPKRHKLSKAQRSAKAVLKGPHTLSESLDPSSARLTLQQRQIEAASRQAYYDEIKTAIALATYAGAIALFLYLGFGSDKRSL